MPWWSCSQYHLFRHIDATWQRFGDVSVASRSSLCLACILSNSAHLIPHVRRLSLSLCPGILLPLASVPFAHLETFCLRGGPALPDISHDTLLLAANIIGVPSICCVQVVSVVLEDMRSLGTLFRRRFSALDYLVMDNTIISSSLPSIVQEDHPPQPLVRLISLEITDALGTAPDFCFLHALCPFDASTVMNLKIGVETSPNIVQLMHAVAPSLTTLQIDSTFATPVFKLSAFPALTTLTVLGWYRGGFPAATLLQSVSSHNVIQQLHIRIALLSKADLESLRALDINIGRLPLVHLDRVTVTISRNETNWTGKDAEELFVTAMCGLRDFFPTLGPQGFLTLAYVHGSSPFAEWRQLPSNHLQESGLGSLLGATIGG
ncbi:hypothetical protein B0H14DRAFT_2610225 [Mycena olivaceomarginata]|nr:hypothetical protein B0H14DRAFT_2610225 [Mycena olivaceomarginata]